MSKGINELAKKDERWEVDFREIIFEQPSVERLFLFELCWDIDRYSYGAPSPFLFVFLSSLSLCVLVLPSHLPPFLSLPYPPSPLLLYM